MKHYYNEWDKYAAKWIENLIAAKLIPDGDVDTRSIKDVQAADLKGYVQCHFFTGIAGWPLALKIAGWPIDKECWTGSAPCQPFSVAGKQKAQKDDRHLWPAWFNLIKSVKPAVVFGEQVPGAIAHGWLDDAFDDLEGEGYETAACVLPACSVGAPHKRDRLWFVADSSGPRGWGGERQNCEGTQIAQGSSIVADTNDKGSQGRNGAILPECSSKQLAGEGNTSLDNTESAKRTSVGAEQSGESNRPANSSQRRYTNWDSESGIRRLANGIPARASKLRAYGNAIVPQLAAEFIRSFMECGYAT